MKNVSVNGQQVVEPIKCWYTGSDTLYNGYLVCFNHDAAAADYASDARYPTAYLQERQARRARAGQIEKPSYNALLASAFAGIVVNAPPRGIVGDGTEKKVEIIPIVPGEAALRDVDVMVNHSVAAGDILGPCPGSYYAIPGVFPGAACFRASVAVDGSTTAALCNGVFGRIRMEDLADKFFRVFDHFDGSKPIVLGGATPAEVKYPGYLISGSSVAIAGTNDPGGRMAITPNGTNIAQLNMPGIAAFTASSADLLPFTLGTGKACFFRAKVNFGVGAVDNSAFVGLSITGAVPANGTVPATDSYVGFFKKVDDDGSLFFGVNRSNGTDNLTDTGINTVADTMYDVAFLVVNRVAGDAASATTIYVWVDGELKATLTSAAINALIPKAIPLGLVFGGIDGNAAVVIEIDRIEACINL